MAKEKLSTPQCSPLKRYGGRVLSAGKVQFLRVKTMTCESFQTLLHPYVTLSSCSWVKIHEPWGLLDEEGDDEEFEDTVRELIEDISILTWSAQVFD